MLSQFSAVLCLLAASPPSASADAGTASPHVAASVKPLHHQPKMLDSAIDLEQDEDDDAPIPPKQDYTPRFGGTVVEGLRCGEWDHPKLPAARKLIESARKDARSCLKVKCAKAALAKSEQVLKLEPSWGQSYLIKGSALALLKRTEEALRTYETYVLSCPAGVMQYHTQTILSNYLQRIGAL